MLHHKRFIALIIIFTFSFSLLFETGIFNPRAAHAYDAPPKDQWHTGPNPDDPDKPKPPEGT